MRAWILAALAATATPAFAAQGETPTAPAADGQPAQPSTTPDTPAPPPAPAVWVQYVTASPAAVDRSNYPRDVARGGAMLTLNAIGAERRTLLAPRLAAPPPDAPAASGGAPATPPTTSETPATPPAANTEVDEIVLSAYRLDARTVYYCGQRPDIVNIPNASRSACFYDADNDGDADQVFAIVTTNGANAQIGPALALPSSIPMRPTPAQRTVISLTYDGPEAGHINEGDRLSMASLRLGNMREVDGQRVSVSDTPQPLLCITSNECAPVPLPGGAGALIVSNVTLDGPVHVVLVTEAEAQAARARFAAAAVAALAADRAANPERAPIPVAPVAPPSGPPADSTF